MASATSPMTSTDAALRAARLGPASPRVPSAPAILGQAATKATRPKIRAVSKVSPSANPSTARLIPTSRNPGTATDLGTRETSAGAPQ